MQLPDALNEYDDKRARSRSQRTMGIAMWRPRSSKRDEEYATATEQKKAKRYGGAVRSNVSFDP